MFDRGSSQDWSLSINENLVAPHAPSMLLARDIRFEANKPGQKTPYLGERKLKHTELPVEREAVDSNHNHIMI